MTTEEQTQPVDPYEVYKVDPSQENLNKVIKHLEPTIGYALANVNGTNDPVLKTEAKVVAAEAVKSFDPVFGASLQTHVANGLRRMSRIARQHKSPVKLPERVQLYQYHLYNTEKEFTDKHGREPDLTELSDLTGLSMKQIDRAKNSSVALGTNDTMDTGEEISFEEDAIEYVYLDSDYIDRKILEHKLGYGGAKVLQPKEIAQKLKIYPSQISKRSAKLMLKINEIIEAFESQ